VVGVGFTGGGRQGGVGGTRISREDRKEEKRLGEKEVKLKYRRTNSD